MYARETMTDFNIQQYFNRKIPAPSLNNNGTTTPIKKNELLFNNLRALTSGSNSQSAQISQTATPPAAQHTTVPEFDHKAGYEYSYNADGSFTSTSADGNEVINYDNNGKEIGGTSNGIKFTTELTENGSVRKYQDGSVTNYDRKNRETGGRTADGQTYSTYFLDGNICRKNRTTGETAIYDRNNNLIRTLNNDHYADGVTEKNMYNTSAWKKSKNPHNNGYSLTNPQGNIQINYDASGKETGGVMNNHSFDTKYNADGSFRRDFAISVDSNGNESTMANNYGHISYDRNGNEIGGTYNNNGDMQYFRSEKDGHGNTVRYYYEDKNSCKKGNYNYSIKQVIDPNGREIEYFRMGYGETTSYVNQNDTVYYNYSGPANGRYENGQYTYGQNGRLNRIDGTEHINGLETHLVNGGIRHRSMDMDTPQMSMSDISNAATSKIKDPSNLQAKGIDNNTEIERGDTKRANGKLDGYFTQGDTGDCWYLNAMNAIMKEPGGLAYLNSLISEDSNGNVIVRLPGVNRTYTITQSEIENSNFLSNGDRDARAFEIAADRYLQETGYKPGEFDNGTKIGTGGVDALAWKILLPPGTKINSYYSFPQNFDTNQFNKPGRMYCVSFTPGCLGTAPDGGRYPVENEHAYTVLRSDSKYVYLQQPWGKMDPNKVNDPNYNVIKVPIKDFKAHCERMDVAYMNF